MTVTSTRHGLSVYTGADATHGADTADNRRLHRPVDEAVSNTFNDATSGHRYDHPAGHEGIDFACGTGTDVRAMYGGIVVKIETGHQSYGTLVTVRSCTGPAKGVGFEHTYAHLQSTAASLKVGDSVAKGDRIGVSGTTGTTDAHLHVHLKAFGPDGTITKDDELGWDGVTVDHKRYTDVASRILGCLNFACFLPPDNSADAPPINENFPLAPDRKLLSPRDAFDTEIPVFVNRFDNYNSAKSYSPNSTETNSAGEEEFRTYPAYVWGKEIACYTVLEHYPVNSNNPTWYKIRHSDWKNGKIVGVIEGWVPSHGRVRERKPGTTSTDDKGLFHDNVAWVQVENAPATMPEVQARPHFATTDTAAVKVHSLPSTTGSSVRARLTAGRCHAITGVYWDRAVIVPDTPRRWWLLQYGTDANDRPLTGWVRGEEVWAYGDETGVTAYTGPADNPRPAPGVPKEVAVLPVAESVTVSWKPPANAAAGLRGYRIWRGRSPESLKKIHQARAGTTSWTDQPTTPLGTLYYYAVSAYRIEIEGERSPAVGIITGHGPLDGTKTLAVAERNTHTRSTPSTGPNSLAVMLDSVFHEVKGVLWKNKLPVSLAVALPPTRPSAPIQEGWVPVSAVKVLGTNGTPVAPTSPAGIRLLAPVTARSFLRLRSWVTGLHLRTGPSTAFAIHRLLTDTSVWYAVTGRTATTPVWYRLRYDATFQGWVRGDYVELSESAPAVAAVTPPAMPAETGPAHEAGTGTGTTTGSASGDFRNLVTNPDGRWAVSKSGTTVTANFSSPRSPVQYLIGVGKAAPGLKNRLRKRKKHGLRVGCSCFHTSNRPRFHASSDGILSPARPNPKASAPSAAGPEDRVGPVGGGHGDGPQRLPECGAGGPVEPGSGLAHDPPVPAGMALRRLRPGGALRGAVGGRGLFRAPPALGPGLVAGLRTDAGRRSHGQGRGPGGPGRERGLPGPGHPRGLAPQDRRPTRSLDAGPLRPAGPAGARRAGGHDRARALRPGPAEPRPVGRHPPPGLAPLHALRPKHDLPGHDRTALAGLALRGRRRPVHGHGREGLPRAQARLHPDCALGARPGSPLGRAHGRSPRGRGARRLRDARLD